MLKRVAKILAGLLLLITLVFTGLLFYVQHNQQKILAAVIAELKEVIRGELTVGNAELNLVKDFPRLSLQLNNISVKDSVYKRQVIGVDHVFFRLNLLSLLTGNIYINTTTIEGGNIIFIKDSSGYSNANVFRTGPDTEDEPGDIDLHLERLKLVNFHLIFTDVNYGQKISINAADMSGNIEKNDTALDIFLQGLLHTDSMLFKDGKGAYLINKDAQVKMHMTFESTKGRFKILPSPVVMDGEEYTMDAVFKFDKQPANMRMHIVNRQTVFSKAQVILPDTIRAYMKDLQINSPIDAEVVIEGDIVPGMPPQVDAIFIMKKANMTAYNVKMTEVDMKVRYMNYMVPEEKHDEYNSSIFIDMDYANAEGIPFKAKMAVKDLIALNTEVSFSSNASLQAFNGFLPADKYKFTSGNVDINLAYKGTLYYYLDTFNRNFNDTLLCTIKAVNGGFAYYARNIKLENFNADLTLTEQALDVTTLNGVLNGNKLAMTGTIANMRRAIANDAARMQGELFVDAPNFDLTKILTEKVTKEMGKAPPATKGEMKKAAQAIDELTGRIDVLLHLRSNSFTFRKFVAKDVKGDMAVSANGMLIKNLQLKTCDGTVQLKGGLNTAGAKDKLDVQAQIKGVDVALFMKSAEEFSQDAVTSKNLAGKLTANASFATELNAQYQPNAENMQAVVFFSLVNGKIMNFEPMMNVGKNVFKKRDFSNVSFAEIKDSIIVDGKEIKLKRMEIASSVLRLFVMGNYKVNGPYEFLIEFPLNNLKAQDINYKPENIGVGAKTGAAIFVSVKGDGTGKPKIGLAPNGKKKFRESL
jgi:hypothetical protein